MDEQELRSWLAEGLSLEQIGRRVGRHPSTVAYWLAKYGLAPPGREKHAPRGGIPREHLEALVEANMSIAQIAGSLDRSKATVRPWLIRYGLKTRPGATSKAAKQAGLVVTVMHCAHHGDTEFCLDGRGYYRCRQCRSAAVTRRRRKVKTTLVQEAGGACCICGYDRTMRALHFHHLEPSRKRHEINARGVAISLAKLRIEAQKCVLLCSNCHAEVEDGIAFVPTDALHKLPPG
jgi:transposase